MTEDDVRAIRMAAITAAAIVYAGSGNRSEYIIAAAKGFADYIIHGE